MATNSIINKINGTDSSANRIASSFYCTCDTAASTKQKDATPTDSCVFDNSCLITGVTVFVKFTNTNTNGTATLKVGTSSAKSIKCFGTTATGQTETGSWYAGSVVSFTYDGTNWIQNDYKYNTNTTYTLGTSGNKITLSPSGSQTQSVTAPYATEAGSAANASLVNGKTVGTDVPSDAVFTDNKVKQTNDTTTNSNLRILFSNSANDTTETAGVKKSGNLLYNPYENELTAGYFTGTVFRGGIANVDEAVANSITMQYEDEQQEMQYRTLLSVDSDGEYSGQLMDWLKPIALRVKETTAFTMSQATHYYKLEQTIKANGLYIAIASANFAAKQGGTRTLAIQLDNGNPNSSYYGDDGTVSTTTSFSTTSNLTSLRIFPAKVGDTVSVHLYQSTSGTLSCSSHSLTLYRLSPFYGYWPTSS